MEIFKGKKIYGQHIKYSIKNNVFKKMLTEELCVDDVVMMDRTDTSAHSFIADKKGQDFNKDDVDDPVLFQYESLGNKNLLRMLPAFLDVVQNDGLLLIDEFSSGFHNELESLLIKLFNKESTDAQMIFVSHSTNLLTNSLLRPDLVKIFEGISDINDFYNRLTAAVNIPESKEVFIFFDEVQECKDIVTWLKFLVEDGKYRFVLSGSLLGVELSDLRSAPVGFLRTIDMFPLDLFEFFTAMGVKDSTLELIQDCFDKRRPLDDFVHQQLMKIFNLYLIVGGMPEAVQKYIDTNDLSQVAQIQKDIIAQYKKDFTKYEKKEKLQLREIYDVIPSELEEKNKRFFINHIGGKIAFARVKNSFVWLKDAGVALPVYNVTEPKLPLKISEKRNLFKLFLSDVGLLTSLYSNDVKLKILTNENDINGGGIFENVVAQELATRNMPLFYFNSKKQGELDFVFELGGKVVPIEVKSGKDYAKHSALNNCLNDDNYGISEAFVFCNNNLSVDTNIIYFPIYMIACVKDQSIDGMIYKLDIEGI